MGERAVVIGVGGWGEDRRRVVMGLGLLQEVLTALAQGVFYLFSAN